jgi:hypothetical protein
VDIAGSTRLDEAVAWIKRCPNPRNEESEIKIRQLFELEDFGASEAAEHHRRLSDQLREVNRLSYPASRLPNNASTLPITRARLLAVAPPL